ncbi:MAG TPA: SUMF1/EgtB/PvdO family nonheme iron enzyme [Pyrinomonadaceae bacterium]|jgi:formylglycine-generating enzyme required for sulfatase activity
MTEKKEQIIQTAPLATAPDELRLLPFAVAGLVCFTIAVVLGTGSWLVFGSRAGSKIQAAAETNFPIVAADKPEMPASSEPSPNSPASAIETAPAIEKSLPEGVVAVAGSEIAIGGGATKMPLERVIVPDFAIAETEVTNAQYAEFIKETNRPAPANWPDGAPPAGRENYPVTSVSFKDTQDFCAWLSRKTGLPVRLPSEAEWELAARGTTANKYPWGNEWKKDAASSEETGGRVSAVKSFALNRSPFGAYDMAGNVWEWTQDKVSKSDAVLDPRVKQALENGEVLRIVKGGSAFEKSDLITVQSRYEIPQSTKDVWVGFRYVIERKQNP